MQMINLDGRWTVRKAGDSKQLDARVPGCIHLDLLRAKQIPDPYYRDNEVAVQWVGEAAWIYSRTFEATAGLLRHERVLLRCEGLDTLAEIRVNGRKIGAADNMFRTWEFDVRTALRAGTNSIEIRFNSPVPYIQARQAEHPIPSWAGPNEIRGRAWVRKEPCNFGWDWGPILITCGIWRSIRLVAFNTARLTDVEILQDHVRKGLVRLAIRAQVERRPAARLRARISVFQNGGRVAQETVPLRGAAATVCVDIRNPKLWWPHGMGDQPLYNVTVELFDGEGVVIDAAARRIGLRTLVLERKKDRWGESFQFAANGVAFFAKGANWIPADAFAPRLTHDDYARLVGDAAAANMNMLRVWGGGIYESDAFYDLCDELGICIWQDFMFACSTYPAFDRAFMRSVRAEAEDNVRRMRHHACIALWCGNNELEQGLVGPKWTQSQMSWADYSRLFDKLLPEVVARLDPQRDYWPCSPHTPVGDRKNFNDPTCGDAHLWSVWHGREPFEWYRTCTHRFNSEFGFQSFPEPRTVRSYTEPGDRNVTSRVMEHHQRSGIGNTVIMQYMLSWFRLPLGFDRTLWLSQILQGMAIKYAVENWRRSMPRGMGTIYWQFNDCWPVASWSSVDSFGRWKALHYMAKRFYAPLMVSGVEDVQKGTVELHVTSDLLCDLPGEVSWVLTDVSGRRVASGARRIGIQARSSSLVQVLNLARHLKAKGPRDLLLWLELTANGRKCSDNLVLFARPKHLELSEPAITPSIRALKGGAYRVTLRSRHPALWTWLELEGVDARLSDNFVNLRPGRAAQVVVQPAPTLTAGEFRRRLRVRSVVDTY